MGRVPFHQGFIVTKSLTISQNWSLDMARLEDPYDCDCKHLKRYFKQYHNCQFPDWTDIMARHINDFVGQETRIGGPLRNQMKLLPPSRSQLSMIPNDRP